MKDNKHLNKSYNLELIHYILFGIIGYIIIAILVSCSTTNISSKKGIKVCHERCYFKSIKNN